MASYDAYFFGFNAEEFAHTSRNEAVARSVSTPTTDVVLFVIFIRNGIHISLGRHGLVESRVEHEHLRQVGQHFLYSHIAFEVCFAMKRSEFHILLPLFEHLVGYNLALREATTGHDTMTCCADFVEALDCSVLRIEQGVEHEFDTLGVSGAS